MHLGEEFTPFELRYNICCVCVRVCCVCVRVCWVCVRVCCVCVFARARMR
jgi:hypothetical protein